jgi:hypothetical protein
MSLAERFRAYLASADFAVTAGAVVVALVAGAVAFETLPADTDGYFVVLLAGVAVPGFAREQWQRPFDSRLQAAAWGAGAAVIVSLAYAMLATLLRVVAGDTVATILAFAATWILGQFAARTLTNDPA